MLAFRVDDDVSNSVSLAPHTALEIDAVLRSIILDDDDDDDNDDDDNNNNDDVVVRILVPVVRY